MTKAFLLTLLLAMASSLRAQNVEQLPARAIKASFGISRHGTGDIKGVTQTFEFEKYFRKRIFWSGSVGSTINYGEYPQFYIDENRTSHDVSYRYTVAGIQVAGSIGVSVVRTKFLNLGLKGGALFRFQSSSAPNSLTTYFPAGTNLPFPVMLIENTTPQNTYSPGGLAEVFANYFPNRKYSFGLKAGIQGDTNGDVLFPQIGVSIGRTF